MFSKRFIVILAVLITCFSAVAYADNNSNKEEINSETHVIYFNDMNVGSLYRVSVNNKEVSFFTKGATCALEWKKSGKKISLYTYNVDLDDCPDNFNIVEKPLYEGSYVGLVSGKDYIVSEELISYTSEEEEGNIFDKCLKVYNNSRKSLKGFLNKTKENIQNLTLEDLYNPFKFIGDW